MKLTLLALSFASSAFAAAYPFQSGSPVPAQLQAQVLETIAASCPQVSAASFYEESTKVYEAAGEQYFETKFRSEAGDFTVISGIGRLGGSQVIKADCE